MVPLLLSVPSDVPVAFTPGPALEVMPGANTLSLAPAVRLPLVQRTVLVRAPEMVCDWAFATVGAIAASAPIMAKVNTVRRPAVNCGGCLHFFMTVIQVELQVDVGNCNDAC